ncbi:hypothetical protein BD289DRAFT_380025, partial [Coniella lustricola]
HLIGSPLALADEAYAERAWVPYADMAALTSTSKITVLQGSATSIDPAAKIATVSLHHQHSEKHSQKHSQKHIPYDYLIVATGLRRVWPVVPQSLTRAAYLAEARAHISAVRAAASWHDHAGIVVVGGGAVGIEMAAELKLTHPAARVTLVHSHEQLLSSEALPDEAKDVALGLLHEAGVETLLGTRVAGTREIVNNKTQTLTQVTLTNGHTILASAVIKAISHSRPSTSFLPCSALDPATGLIRAQPNLMFPDDGAVLPNAASHFAVGDAVRWSGIKRCGAAMHFGYIAAHNIHEKTNKRSKRYEPAFKELGEIPPMIGLAVGKKAMSYSPGQGVAAGEDVMKAYFGDDLGFDICWRYMKLGLPVGREEKE